MAYLPKNNPARFLIESAANGRKLTNADLAMLEDADAKLPAGQTMSRHREAILQAANRVAQVGASGNRGAAMQAAEDAWSELAERMSTEAAALDSTDGPNSDQAVADAVARAFQN